MFVKLKFSNCSSRDGSQDYELSDFEQAVKDGIGYCQNCAKDGKFGIVDVLFYELSMSIPLRFQMSIECIFSGERYQNGYAIPVNTQAVELVLLDDFEEDRSDFRQYVEKATSMLPDDSHYRDISSTGYHFSVLDETTYKKVVGGKIVES